ncbi:hypothetical protein HK097_009351 [Rhizophlyctis rosea]|uniref:Doublecortin domain-containing protein n=1 Tax=Rhizophlyctis rosea TaxID=64517 RepID=A0AAD5X3B4_9FUNG|nr:hypothetical protein HK097_009351 [Rhizophlyctis rosea]
MGKNPANDVTTRLTDTSGYTGTHKQRFTESGQGKGIHGREDRIIFDGNTSSASRDHSVKKSTDSLSSSKPSLSTSKSLLTSMSDLSTPAPKITLFQYADKNHQGDRLVLSKQKFPTFKQLQDYTTKFLPSGKPKIILDEDGTEVKSLDDIVDGGKYLVLVAFDKARLDEGKIPAKFKERE